MIDFDELLTWLRGQLYQEPNKTLAVALWSVVEETIRPFLNADSVAGRNAATALRLLASGYEDREGYRQEWRP